MDDTVSGLWKRCEKLEAERDELQRKLNIAVEALKDIIDFYVNGNSDYRYAEHKAMEALKILEEK